MNKSDWVGRSIPDVQGVAKVTGRIEYLTGMRLPGMLQAKVVRSPYAHARIVRIGVEKAKRLPGVKAILCAGDPLLPDKPFGPPGFADRKIFPEEVRFVGEGVAAVAAADPDIAEEAANLIEVEYEELPAVFDVKTALAPGAPVVHSSGNLASEPIRYLSGNLEEQFARADLVLHREYSTTWQCHTPMEVHCCIAQWDLSGRLEVRAATGGTAAFRFMLAQALQIPIAKVHVLVPAVGGSFGSKIEIVPELEPVCALLAKKAGKPVRMFFSREEEFYTTVLRHPATVELRIGVSPSKDLLARQARCWFNTGAYAALGHRVLCRAMQHWLGHYRAQATGFEGMLVYTNGPVASAYRGFGGPQINFAMECALDEISEELKVDPMELIERWSVQTGDESQAYPGHRITSCGLKECLKIGAQAIGWDKKKRLVEEAQGSHLKRGIGLSTSMYYSSLVAQNYYMPTKEGTGVYIKANEDGSFDVLVGCVETGQGSTTALSQIAAEGLGVTPSQVRLYAGDSDVVPYDTFGSVGQRTTYVVGSAIHRAAMEVRRQLREQAARLLAIPEEDVNIGAGKAFSGRDPACSVTLAELVSFAHFRSGSPVAAVAGFTPVDDPPSFCAHFAEVEVDTKTGLVQVLRIVAAHDVGRAVNPLAVEGQIEGGIHHGLGLALSEQLILDDLGTPINASLEGYGVLTVSETPEIVPIIVETIDPSSPFGVKGVGEIATSAVAPAVANAINQATGVRIRNLPITPDRVLEALKNVRQESR